MPKATQKKTGQIGSVDVKAFEGLDAISEECGPAGPRAELVDLIDLTRETPLALKELPGFLAGLGFPKPHEAIGYRWAARETRGRKLATVRLGNALFTTKEAVLRFLQADVPSKRAPGITTRRVTRERQVQAAERRAQHMGF